MIFSEAITAVDSHTMGEPARVVVGAPIGIRGKTVREKRDFVREHLDYLRTAVINEPRGHSGMFAVIVTEACHPEADVGLIFMDNQGYVNMCVHATVASAVVLLETGRVRSTRPVTTMRFETPSGLVTVAAEVSDDKVDRVHLTNVPSVMLLADAEVQVRGNELRVDVSYGGNTFAIVSADQLGVPVRQTHVDELVGWGMDIRDAVNEQLEVQHPENESLRGVNQVLIYGQPTVPGAHAKNVIISGYGKVDRSPCGTGTCARLAVLHAKDQWKENDVFVNEGIIGTTFECRIEKAIDVGGLPGIVPRISGNAHITGFNTLLLDPRDPLVNGFMLKHYD
jgi:proline racemase